MKKSLKGIDLALLSQLCFSVLTIIMGIVIMTFKAFGLTKLVLYTSSLFYIYAFLSIIAYFIKRREGDYELLILSLIHVVVATILYAFKDSNMNIMLGAAILIYSILYTCNRLYKIYQLKRAESYMWVVKLMVTILVCFLGLLTSLNFYTQITVQTMMLGYYFITLGIMITIESIIELFITEDQYRRLLKKVLANESKMDEIKEEKLPEIKTVSTKKKTVKSETNNKAKAVKKSVTKKVEEAPKRKPGRPKKIN